MNNFLPERIYNKVKDIADYQVIDKLINDNKTACVDIVSFLMSDDILSEKFADAKSKLSMIIRQNCPIDYYLQYQVMFINDEQSLLNTLSLTSDVETKLMIYQELYSFMNKLTFEQYMQEYIILYEANSNIYLSSKMHIEYFLFKCFFYRRNVIINSNMVQDFIEFMNTLIDQIKSECDLDTLNHLFVRQLAEFFADAANIAKNDNIIVDYIKQYPLTIPNFEYKNYSYHVMQLEDKLFDLYFSVRDFDNAYKTIQRLIVYMNNALLDKKQLIQGLNFYDYNVSLQLLALITKYKQIGKMLPALNIQFNNLTVQEDIVTNDSVNIIDEVSTQNNMIFFRSEILINIAQNLCTNIISIVQGNNQTYQIFNIWINSNKS